MKRIYLFPNKLKIPALLLFLISAILFIPSYSYENELFSINATVFSFIAEYPFGETMYFTWLNDEISNEIITTLYIVSGIILAFSKEKIEDEFIQSIRFKALVQSTYFTYAITLICVFFTYGIPFFSVVTLLIFVNLLILNTFYYTKLFIYKKQFSYENED
ncbi:MAG: hypothetical protein Q4G18_02260 [Myroides sp.]|nr:hypothetical protein [Myroides sp.]